MDFLEAAEIAKKNPGAHFTRGESGLFVVHLKDGRIISSPDQLTISTSEGIEPTSTVGDSRQLQEIAKAIASLSRQLDTSNAEILQLRREVNNLKGAISKIPASEWSRYEDEQKKIDQERQDEERHRIVGLARAGKLSHEQLNLVADNARQLGIPGDDLEFIRSEISRTRRRRVSPDSLVVHATTDGQ